MPKSIFDARGVAYCAGVGEDVSFDLALARAGLEVWSFDPTPRSAEFIAGYVDTLHFEPVGWWDADDTLRFYGPADERHISHSIDNLQHTAHYFEARVETVDSIKRRLQHDRLSIIKMDIEGAERRVIPSLLSQGPHADVLCIEFDYPYTFSGLSSLLNNVLKAGYEVLNIERRNYTFGRTGPRS